VQVSLALHCMMMVMMINTQSGAVKWHDVKHACPQLSFLVGNACKDNIQAYSTRSIILPSKVDAMHVGHKHE